MSPDESRLWQGVTQELMSDEEDMGNSLKVKSPNWRSQELTSLIRQLDARIVERNAMESRQQLRKSRVEAASPMKRKPSKKVKAIHVDNETDE